MSTFNNKSLCDEALVKYHDVTHCRAIRCLVSLRHFLKEMYWFLKTCLSSSLHLGMHVGETLSLLIKHNYLYLISLIIEKKVCCCCKFPHCCNGWNFTQDTSVLVKYVCAFVSLSFCVQSLNQRSIFYLIQLGWRLL